MTDQLNDDQKRHLLVTCEHIDGLLTDALQVLSSAESPSPFQQHLADSLPIQRKVIGDYLIRLRSLMVRILESQGIEIPKPHLSSLKSFQTMLMFAQVAVDELAPKYMRGYGELKSNSAHELELVMTQLRDLLDRMSGYLAANASQDLQGRLAKLAETTHEVPLAKLLEQVITNHGLVELRLSLAAVIERMESSSFEVAVFGRVNSGKSSLLNHILQTDVLPVGVTPVTAIPTWVVFGQRPLARIWFAEEEAITIEPRELGQYVTEQENRDNARHVTRIQLELPSERLKDGVTFVDTPGLGSLARYGEMESLAYLPRCDLGIVLVDASSTLIQEDASIVNALCQAGAGVMVLLTKADMLAPGERITAAQYVKDQIHANLGLDLPVYVVSVKGADAVLCDRWFETALVPSLREHRRLAEASLRRKVGLLREATIAALQRRLDKRSAAGAEAAGQWTAVEPVVNMALARLETAMRDRLDATGIVLAGNVLDAAAQELANQLRHDRSTRTDASTTVISCGNPQANRFATEVAKSLSLIRENLISVLHDASAAIGHRHEDCASVPMPSGMPILDLTAKLPETPMRRPRLAFLISRRSIYRQLFSHFGATLATLLDQYIWQVGEWRLQVLAEMRKAFTAGVGFCRAQCEDTNAAPELASVENDLRRLQDL